MKSLLARIFGEMEREEEEYQRLKMLAEEEKEKEMEEEIAELEKMDESEACRIYNVDNKVEALQGIYDYYNVFYDYKL